MEPRWIVCVKHVPREPVFKKTDGAFQIDRQEAGGILNPCDRSALRVALALRAKGGGEVVTVSMGPPQAEEALLETLAHGADRAYLLCDPRFAGSDTLATAYTLAAAVRKVGGGALILCGAATLDSDTGQVGPQLAEFLDLPMASKVHAVALRKQDAVRVERTLDGFRERLAIRLPALLTICGPAREADPVSLRSLQDAFEHPAVVSWSAEDLQVQEARIGWKGSGTLARDLSYWKRERSGERVHEKPGAAAERILEALAKRGVLGGG